MDPQKPCSSSLTTLSTGLRVAHQRVPGALTSIYLWFDAGTIDEGDGEAGAAHLLEHMLFKGTPTLPVGKAAAAIEAFGGDLNAYTVWDQTVLHATVLADHWREAIQILADMAWQSCLAPEELAREKGVVLEEIRSYEDEPESVVEDALTALLFPSHPYGKPVLGTQSSVETISADTLQAFWRRNYGAKRCVLAIAGPVHLSDVISVAEALQPFEDSSERSVSAPPDAEPSLARLSRSFETPIIAAGFRTVPDSHPDAAALEILSHILGEGRGSRLSAKLRLQDELVVDAWASHFTRRHGGALELWVIPRPEKTQAALDALRQLIDTARCGFDAREVERAKQSLLSDQTYASESVEAIAHDLAWFTSRTGSPSGRDTWRQQVSLTDVAHVTQVAQTYLHNPVIRVLSGGPISNNPIQKPNPIALPFPLLCSGTNDGHPHQGPITSICVAFRGGSLFEDIPGLTIAWSGALTAGTVSHTEVQLSNELEHLSASLVAIPGRLSGLVQLTVPNQNLRPALSLLHEIIHEPRFDRTDWSRLQAEMRFDHETLPDRPDEVLRRRVWQLAYPNHPWGKQTSTSTVSRVTVPRLRAYHRTLLQSSVCVGLSSSVPRQIWGGALAALGATWGQPPTPTPPSPGPQPTGHFRRRAGQEQTLISYSTRTPPVGVHPKLALRVGAGVLSSQAGRLFFSLRERRSLAYSVWSHAWESPYGGLFTTGLATDPARAAEAKRVLIDEVERLRDNGPTVDELERVRATIFGQFAMAQQRAARRAAHLSLVGLFGQPPGIAALKESLDAVTVESVRRALSDLPELFVVEVIPR